MFLEMKNFIDEVADVVTGGIVMAVIALIIILINEKFQRETQMSIQKVFSLIYYKLKKAITRVVDIFLVFAEGFFRYKRGTLFDKEAEKEEDIPANFR